MVERHHGHPSTGRVGKLCLGEDEADGVVLPRQILPERRQIVQRRQRVGLPAAEGLADVDNCLTILLARQSA